MTTLSTTRTGPMTVSEIQERLEGEYGPHPWRIHREPISELVRTILSQNTSDVNSNRAFQGLLSTFGDFETVAQASVEDIAAAIHPGGLARVKAPRIKGMLQEIKRSRGSLSLDFLADLPLSQAKAWLQRLPGVGPKTAACVLLFSLGRPALPVDTHVYRVSRRLGLIGARVSPERAQEVLEALVPPQDIYRFHLLLIEHGRKVCQARRPRCRECVLAPGCPSAPFFVFKEVKV